MLDPSLVGIYNLYACGDALVGCPSIAGVDIGASGVNLQSDGGNESLLNRICNDVHEAIVEIAGEADPDGVGIGVDGSGDETVSGSSEVVDALLIFDQSIVSKVEIYWIMFLSCISSSVTFNTDKCAVELSRNGCNLLRSPNISSITFYSSMKPGHKYLITNPWNRDATTCSDMIAVVSPSTQINLRHTKTINKLSINSSRTDSDTLTRTKE
jgi:hypothetical protein